MLDQTKFSVTIQVRDSLGGAVGPSEVMDRCQDIVKYTEGVLRRWECQGHKRLPLPLRKQAVLFVEDVVKRTKGDNDYGERMTVGCSRQIELTVTYTA